MSVHLQSSPERKVFVFVLWLSTLVLLWRFFSAYWCDDLYVIIATFFVSTTHSFVSLWICINLAGWEARFKKASLVFPLIRVDKFSVQ